MAFHSLRCSLFWVDEDGRPEGHNRKILGALASFYDRFTGREGRSGTILFSEGARSEFRPREEQPGPPAGGRDGDPSALWPDLSVRDPTAAAGVELAPQISPATRLLYAFELQRARRLSSDALDSIARGGGGGSFALQELF